MRSYKVIRLALATALLSPVILASGAIVSEAADVPRAPGYGAPPPPLPLPFYLWTGVGVHAGGGWADLGVGDTGSGFIGGGQVGYNYQINQWVFGLEADISGSGIKNNLATHTVRTHHGRLQLELADDADPEIRLCFRQLAGQ
jgi:hypothetical protein